MNPQPCAGASFPSKVQRKVLCVHYEACLDLTIKKTWPSFNCDHCRDFERIRMEPAEQEEDALRCALLLVAVISPSGYKCQTAKGIMGRLE